MKNINEKLLMIQQQGSLIYMGNRRGPRIDPWGATHVTGKNDDVTPFTQTL